MKWSIAIEAFGDGTEETPATITAVMQENADGVPQIVELTVRAPEGGEIAARAARDIDFEMLARAIGGAAAAIPRSGTADDGAKAPAEAKERPYRKMPDVDEVKEVFLRTESVGKLARHYSVPRYTAQAWVDRLRRKGLIPDGKRGG